MNSELYENNEKYVPICKDCLAKLFDRVSRRANSDKMALLVCCHYLDVVYVDDLYESLKANQTFSLGVYLRSINGKQYKSKNFSATLMSGSLYKTPEQVDAEREVKWSSSDLLNKRDVIDVVGYDPFEGYTEFDRKYLFNDLSKYLDEDIRDDTYVLSAIIQIVNNNNQLRKYDLLINKHSADAQLLGQNADVIEQLTALKKKITDNTNNLAKENEISLKNRSNKDVGKSTLGYLQKKLRELDFEEAEANYYSQLCSPGTQWAIDMSHKSIVENGMFDENDKKEIFDIQRGLVLDLQKKLDDEQEKSRLLQIEIDKLRSGNKNAKK